MVQEKGKEKEAKDNFVVFRYGNIVAFQEDILGKNMLNSYPRKSPVKSLSIMTQTAIDRGLNVITGITVNAVENDATVAGSTVVLVLAIAPDGMNLDSIVDISNESPVNLLNEEEEEFAYGAIYAIPGSVYHAIVERFSPEATHPLMAFAHKAVEKLGPNISITVDDERNWVMRCSAIRLK